MFLPFAIALVGAVSIYSGRKQVGFGGGALLLLITVVWFGQHVTDPLALSF
ncbi:DUF5993 family protein [Pseudomonas chlororaphis]